MKRLLVLLLSVLAAAPIRAEMDRSVLFGLSQSVLKIEVLRDQGGFSLGSGVVIAPERVVTNCHVTRDAVRINVLRGGIRRLVVSQFSDLEHDLCLLNVPGLVAKVLAPGRADDLQPGQPVTALGYTGGLALQHSPGEVLALHRLDGGRVIQSSNWFNSGASGGGLIDDDQKLVGILTFRLRGGEAHYFAAPAEWLAALLQAPDAGFREIAPERSGRLSYWQRPVVDQPRFLKAALLQRDDRWPELEALAADWVRGDASDAEPWFLMGVALERMNRLPQAQRALECALEIDPAFTAVSDRLAPVYDRQGLTEQASQVRSRRRAGKPASSLPDGAAHPNCNADASRR